MKESSTVLKRILVIPIILLVVLISCLVFNRQAVFHGYDDLDAITQFQVEQEKTGKVYTYENPDGIYIRELLVVGNVKNRSKFNIEADYLNEFGKLKSEIIEDRLNDRFWINSTLIRKKVTGLRITIPKSAEADIVQIQFSNHFEWYLDRMLIIFFGCLFFYILIAEPFIREKPAVFFALFSLVFGLLFIRISGPAHTVWDEEVHFQSTYRLACGRKTVWTGAARDVADYIDLRFFDTRLERNQLKTYLNDRAGTIEGIEQNVYSIFSFNETGHLPQALFVKLGLVLKLPFTRMYALGKLGALLLYILVMFVAVSLAGEKRWFLAFLGMCPTPLFVASSYSYDTVCFSFLVLGCVFLFRALETKTKKTRTACLSFAFLSFMIGSLAKIIYIPVVLFMLIAFFRGESKKKKRIAAILVLAVCLLGMATFVIPTLQNLLKGNVSYAGDLRGGDTGIVRQIMSLLRHPLVGLKMFLREIMLFDNFRTTGGVAEQGHLISNQMLLNVGYFGALKDKWSILLIPVLIFLCCTNSSEDNSNPSGSVHMVLSKKETVFAAFVLIFTVMLLWVAMYVGFTEVGEDFVDGVQARYYLPLLFPAACLIPSGCVEIRGKKQNVHMVYGLMPLVFVLLSCMMMLAS